MKRLERLHALSERLRAANPGTISARQLAEEFEVSRRTIERDLDALRRAGATLWGQPGRRGGVGLLDGSKRVVSLTDTEIAGLAIAAHAAASAPFAGHARRAADTLTASAGPEAQASIERIRERVLVADESAAQPEARLRAVLESAIVDGRQVSLSYRDRAGVETTRRVDPVGFLTSNGGWALIAHCHLRGGSRLFRLERIKRATATAQPAAVHDVEATLGEVPFLTRSARSARSSRTSDE